MAKRKPEALPALSEAQLEIMQLVWERGEVTVTDVWSVLAQRRGVARNTVLTLMDRLGRGAPPRAPSRRAPQRAVVCDARRRPPHPRPRAPRTPSALARRLVVRGAGFVPRRGHPVSPDEGGRAPCAGRRGGPAGAAS